MCLIVFHYPNNKISDDYIRAADEKNDDGIGVAWAYQDTLTLKKDFENVDDFINYYHNEIPDEATVLIHFRLVSAGETNIDNRHPFVINDDLVVAHNGHISTYAIKNDKDSDTARFVKLTLQPMMEDCPEAYKSIWFKYLVEDAIGSSKLVFLDKTGCAVIINESSGEWDNDDKKVWLSNVLFKKKIKKEKASNRIDISAGLYHQPQFPQLTYPNFSKKSKNQHEEIYLSSNQIKQGDIYINELNRGITCYYLTSDQNKQPLTVKEMHSLNKANRCRLKQLRMRNIVTPLVVNRNPSILENAIIPSSGNQIMSEEERLENWLRRQAEEQCCDPVDSMLAGNFGQE